MIGPRRVVGAVTVAATTVVRAIQPWCVVSHLQLQRQLRQKPLWQQRRLWQRRFPYKPRLSRRCLQVGRAGDVQQRAEPFTAQSVASSGEAVPSA